jgi:quinol monooxygenase YgiN
MPNVAVLAKISAQPGKRDEVVAALAPMIEAVKEEPGTLVYAMHTDNADADVVWFYELYDSQDSLAAHGGSQAMKEAGGRLAGLVGGRPELFMLTPVGAKGLPG